MESQIQATSLQFVFNSSLTEKNLRFDYFCHIRKLDTMQKILIFLSFVAFSTLGFAQEETQVDDQALPEITFEETVIDYGTIEQGSEPYRTFEFKNTGGAPLIIKNAKGSCGCTVPEWPKKPILPGEVNEIKVRYDTNRLGNFRKTVRLTTNAGEEAVVLTIKGEVMKKEEPQTLPVKEGNMLSSPQKG